MNKYYITDKDSNQFGKPYYEFTDAIAEAKKFVDFFADTFYVRRAHNGSIAEIIEKN